MFYLPSVKPRIIRTLRIGGLTKKYVLLIVFYLPSVKSWIVRTLIIGGLTKKYTMIFFSLIVVI